MFNIPNTHFRSTVIVVTALTIGPHFAFAQGLATSQACGQEQLAGQEKDEQQANTKSMVLAKCDSVIHPPQVGDQEMVEPTPSVGRTPVIKPE